MNDRAMQDTLSRIPPVVGGAWVGQNARMRQIYGLLGRVAGSDSTVLITGESGTGKELLARAIHEHSPRASGPFITVSCAALPDTLLESELFGHEKGAFTDAHCRRPGRFELADKGTLFLDEIGDLSGSSQVKLLRVMQDRCFERLGGTQTLRVDVRVIAATHRDLSLAVAEQHFRHDLFYRLNVIPIHLPPLGERREDMPALCSHFLAKFHREKGLPRKQLSPEALAALCVQDWPGNLRQLENFLERLVVLCEGERIEPRHLELMRELVPSSPAAPQSASLREMERGWISEALQRTGWNRTRAAALLGISRRTLLDKIKRYELHASGQTAGRQ